MILYTVAVTKSGNVVFEHDIAVDATRSFAEDVHDAMENFRKNFGNISLLDDDVHLSIKRKP